MNRNKKLAAWVKKMADLCQPSHIYWCNGSDEENAGLLREMEKSGMATALDPQKRPGCYLFRSDPSDVARVENRTFIASTTEDDAGPTNNWIDPVELKKTMTKLYRGSMKGRTMYVVPFSMGPLASKLSEIGVEITDSPYVVVNMRTMTRMGKEVLTKLGEEGDFIPCLHSVGAPLEDGEKDCSWPCAPIEQKYISHFPQENTIWSYGSGYGGNALLGKKCLALRIASSKARKEGWLAEHMLILKITSPEGEVRYICGAFPSACGKTNLAMLRPTIPGWKVQTIGDDIAWMRFGEDGCLYAINPEAGFFGVAPGTSYEFNYNAMKSMERNVLFTNCALTDDKDVWWEGIGVEAPDHLIDWQGQDWSPDSSKPAAHPNARFSAPASQCPCIAPEWEDPKGVPISAILVGGRRPNTIPLVTESLDWNHGIFLGSIMGSEITAAAISDKMGQVRRDPFAMLPFIGYHVCDYLQHWLDMREKTSFENLPKIYYVNWFRKDDHGKFLWPGFGDNSRVLKWIVQRSLGQVDAVSTPIGNMPQAKDLDIEGLNMTLNDIQTLLEVDQESWMKEVESIRNHYSSYGSKMPKELLKQLDDLERRLTSKEKR